MRAMSFLLLVGIWGVTFLFAREAWPSPIKVPVDWYALPEDGVAEPFNSSKGGKDLHSGLVRIFSAQRKALTASGFETLAAPEALTAPEKRPADWVPWRLAAFVSDLSVSAGGSLGVLAFNGTPSVSVVWSKREPKLKREPRGVVRAASATRLTIPLAADVSDRNLDKQIESIYKAAKVSGRVQAGPRLRADLSRAVHQFRDLTRVVNAVPTQGSWYASTLRADLEISASGRVKWGTVGGALNIRLEWDRLEASSVKKISSVKLPSKLVRKSGLRDLVTAISADLSQATDAWTPAHPRFQPVLFIVGLGLTVDGKIGVARASATALGMIYFSPVSEAKKANGLLAKSEPGSESFLLIDEKPSASALGFAKANAIDTLVSPSGSAAYRVGRAQFREGLKRAFQIGDELAGSALASRGNEWAISELRPGFTMSVGGGLGLATLTGSATAVVILQDQTI